MATAACNPARPSRLTRLLQLLASLFIAVLAVLTAFVGGANLFFYLHDVTRLTDWLLLLIGVGMLLLALISFAAPHRVARTLGVLAVIGFSVIAATAFHVLPEVSADANIAIMAAASYFVTFLLARFLARDHAVGDDSASCGCSH